MKLHHLQYLVAVAERGSVRGAALQLGVSSTAASRGLIELEDLAGMPLLERGAGGVSLTVAGRALLVHARQVLSQLRAADEALVALRGTAPTRLAIGVTPWIARILLGPTIQLLLKRRPDVRLDVHEMMGAEFQALRDGSIDVAIGFAPSEAATEFSMRPLFSFSAAIICRQGHPLANARHLADLEGQDWIISREVEQQAPSVQLLWNRVLGTLGTVRLHYVRSAQVTAAIVRTTDMLAFCPWPMIEMDRTRTLHALALREEMPEQTTVLLTRHNFAASGAAREFIDCFMAAVEQERQSTEPVMRRVFRTLNPPPK